MYYKTYKNLRYRPCENEKRKTIKDLRLKRLHHGYFNWISYNLHGSDDFREKTWHNLWYRSEMSAASKRHKDWKIVFKKFISTKSKNSRRLRKFALFKQYLK